ncbi:MAG: TetR/AcrR family transcriptional regulator [Terriglobia bacterium]|nr:TetR/AcrR family transcriptional regulator [Terriglobia bacterium]
MSEYSNRDTRIRILEAAATKFAAYGFRAATMKQIAAAANVNDVTVYRYFPKKQNLYWAAIDWKVRSSALNQLFVEGLGETLRPREMLERLGERVLGLLLTDRSLGRLIYFAVLELPEERKRLYEGHLKPLLAELTTQIQSWVQAGEVRAVDPHSAALAITGMLWSPYNLQELLGMEKPGQESVKQMAGDFAELCLRGLGTNTTQATVG